MSTNEPGCNKEETGGNEDGDTPMIALDEIAVTTNHEYDLPDREMMSTDMPDLRGDSSRSDHPCQFDGFDLPTVGSLSSYRMIHIEHKRYWHHSEGAFVKVYAQLGLHRYNLLEGTNFQFLYLESYNRGLTTGAAPYYLTLFAACPESDSILPFHALVRESSICCLDISVPIARPRCSEEQPHLCRPTYTRQRTSPLPRWPSSEMFDQRRFHTLSEHELQNTDWLSVYLDLVHSTCHRFMTEKQLSKFYIEQVVIRSLSGADPPRLDDKSLVVYMVYKDLAKARLGKPCYRKAIIRRVYDESSRSLTFQGKHWSFSEEQKKKKKKKEKKRFALLKKRLGVFGAWRLGIDVYMKRGMRSFSRTR